MNFESGPSERAQSVAAVSSGYSLRDLLGVGSAVWSAPVLTVAFTRATGSPSSQGVRSGNCRDTDWGGRGAWRGC